MSRRPRRRSDGGIALVLGGVALGVLGAGAIGGVIAFQLLRQEQPVDDLLCPANSLPSSHTIVVVDQTSAFTATQVATVRAVILQERDAIPVRGRLTLLYLDPDRPSEPTQIFTRCNPGTAADTDPWLADPERVQRNWRRQFEAPLDEALARLMQPNDSTTSPIIQTLRGLEWRPDFGREQAGRRLVIVSDMLENSSLHSLYAANPEDRAFSELEGGSPASVIFPEFAGVVVHVRLLRSENTIPYQDEQFESFWQQYFARTNANLERF